ncbi:MAG TPA: ABC transporter permease [Streptosporangiaceae bacterium]|jgi:NitT/TauT family transport system permease protein|nr:ABC transporter permease [Streptosporangiaceae bacterium]
MSADTEEAAALTGLDNLEASPAGGQGQTAAEVGGKIWRSVWPKLLAVVLGVGLWELVYVANVKPHDILPGPAQVFPDLWSQLTHGQLWHAIGTTMRRAVIGFALALVIGTVVGLVVSRVRAVRAAVGSMITGLQTIPSVVWVPFAIILFGNNTAAILFLVIITAAPSIANGLIAGVDFTPPLLLRAGRTMGLRRVGLYRHLIMPASLPPFVAGLKQGWAFAWHGLFAAELLVLVPNSPSIGVLMSSDQDQTDMTGVISIMIVILVLGIVVDVLFNLLNDSIRRRRGLAPEPSAARP